MKAYIKQVRPDGKIDVVLQNEKGREHVEGVAERLLQELFASEGGCLPYHEKSDPNEIYAAFGVSKKAFKRAVGDLYKRNLINLTDNGIELKKRVK
jgi:predicted RNA-binding protein (virulence factor B family)